VLRSDPRSRELIGLVSIGRSYMYLWISYSRVRANSLITLLWLVVITSRSYGKSKDASKTNKEDQGKIG
jgi:hypothetical protein